MIKGALLDVDGTLVLSNDAHAKAWVEAFKQYGYEVPYETVRPLIGMGGDKLVATASPGLTTDAGDGKLIKEARARIFLDSYVANLQPTPGARPLIQALHDYGLKLVAASSAENRELQALLQAAQVADLLTITTSSDDAEHSKPQPDIIQAALERVGLTADEVVLIGDTPYDIAAGARAGVQCIAVRSGGWKDEDLEGALAVYDNPADVLDHLSGYLEEHSV